MNVDIIGYRDWSKELYERVVQLKPGGSHEIKYHTSTSYTQPFADLTFLVGWSEIVPPGYYRDRTVLVLHPSPLPRYRGGSPIQHQIIDGETASAVSIFRLDAEHTEVDSGPLCWQQGYSLEGSLADVLGRIAAVGAIGVAACIEAAAEDSLAFWEQPRLHTHDPGGNPITGNVPSKRRKPEESAITLQEVQARTARDLHNKVRALQDPYPNAYIVAGDGRRLYITETWYGKDE